jgi:CRISPR-associated exonuclease Cas4
VAADAGARRTAREFTETGPDRFLSASEIEKYAYCPLSWWLSINEPEQTGAALVKGEERHRAIAQRAAKAMEHEREARKNETLVLTWAGGATVVAILGLIALFQETLVSRFMIVIALIWLIVALYMLYRSLVVETKARAPYERAFVIMAIGATVAALTSVEFLFKFSEDLGRGLEVLAIAWLAGAVVFLWRTQREDVRARKEKAEAGIAGKQPLDYVDTNRGESELMVSKKHGVRGRPDYVLVESETRVPVEVKTGRIPKGPLFSHIAQLGAYCILLEERFGVAPPRGVLKYVEQGKEGVEHSIPFDEDLRRSVLLIGEKMRATLRGEMEAHRNHNRPGKCVGCSRRAVCPERLA